MSRAVFGFLLIVSSCLGQQGAPPDGRQLFGATCAACHGLDARGGEHGPDVASAPGIRAFTDEKLLQIMRDGVPHTAMPGFGKLLDGQQLRALLHYLRSLQNQDAVTVLAGDPEAGRKLFFGEARCAECHMMGARGGFIGPDLSRYGATHSAEEIREAVVNPRRFWDSRRSFVVVQTGAGKELSGLIRNEDNFSLQIQSVDGSFHFLNKSGLLRIDRWNKPLMPEDYSIRLSKANLEDLNAYLKKDVSAAAAPKQEDDDN
jgi:cytochrome c oxidase cbb3-type subunit III